MNVSQSATPSGPATLSAPHKRWHVGTLTYTAGGLAVLFCWMLWGDFAWQLKERSAPPVVQLMLRKFEASGFLTGLFLLSLPAVISVPLERSSAIEESGLAALPREIDQRPRLGRDVAPHVGFQHFRLHPHPAGAGVEFFFLEVEAVAAIQVAP